MKQIVILFFSFASLYQSYAQQFIERVYLKDSSFYEGYIIEQVPTQYLKIDRIREKDTLTVPLTLIWKITKSYSTGTASSPKNKINTPKSTYLKTVFLEFLGNGILYSFNFDMRTERNRRDGWGYRIGLEYLGLGRVSTASGDTTNRRLTAIPFGINYLLGKRKGFLELGVGATYFFINDIGTTSSSVEDYEAFGVNLSTTALAGTFNIGYRHVPYKNGITYRFFLSPIFQFGRLTPFVGTSVGYKF